MKRFLVVLAALALVGVLAPAAFAARCPTVADQADLAGIAKLRG